MGDSGKIRLAVRDGASYAVPVAGIDACFDPVGRFDPERRSCPLDDGRGLLVARQPDSATVPKVEDGQGRREQGRWRVTIVGKYCRSMLPL